MNTMGKRESWLGILWKWKEFSPRKKDQTKVMWEPPDPYVEGYSEFYNHSNSLSFRATGDLFKILSKSI